MGPEVTAGTVVGEAVWMPAAIVKVPTVKLVPYAASSRTHSDAQIEAIARSNQRFGFLVPVLIDRVDGIIAGHGRELAALRLKMPVVPLGLVVCGHAVPRTQGWCGWRW